MLELGNRMIVSWRTFALSLLLGIVVGVAYIGEPIDRVVEAAVGRLAWRPVSGDIVVVALDDKTIEQSVRGDFSMAQHARLVDAINAAGAKRLFIDFTYERRQNDRELPLLTAAVKRMKNRVILAAAAEDAQGDKARLTRLPGPAFGHVQIACIGWEYEFWQVWRIPITLDVDGKLVPGHAFVGYRTGADGRAAEYLETTLLGARTRAGDMAATNFAAARAAGRQRWRRAAARLDGRHGPDYALIDIGAARAYGIIPIGAAERAMRHPPEATPAPAGSSREHGLP